MKTAGWIMLVVSLALPDARCATVSGIVIFHGEKPVRKPIQEMAANSFCKDHSKGDFPLSDRFVFGTNGTAATLANVLIYVSKGAENRTFAVPSNPVVIDQIGCVYTPHVVALLAGQTLEIRNSDETLHNVMSQPRFNKSFNDGMPGTGKRLVKVFEKPELNIQLKCFMHPWMMGLVHVMENPYFAVTGMDGNFSIKDLPAGEYEFTVFHEYSRFIAAPEKLTVKLEKDETKTIEFRVRSKIN